ncbi:MAG TPA: hypothetical protein VMS93_04760 [Candidatus Saccharimonadales bacterium]|nr:hypothetical protein [Candidatus Saccharimonadales bacterium]
MNDRQLFKAIRDSSRNPAPSYYFALNCVLFSRTEPGPDPSPGGFEAAARGYLEHLLRACADPTAAEGSRQYLSRYDLEAFKRLQACADARLKYVVYRTDTDFLLVSVGIFQQAPDPRQKRFPPAEDASLGRSAGYYQFSYTYGQYLHRQDTAVAEVLEKLSVGFEKYVKILSHLRGEHFDLATHLASGEFYCLELAANEDARRLQIKEREDRFLETYAQWRRTGGEELKAALQRQAEEIRRLKPDFKFSL